MTQQDFYVQQEMAFDSFCKTLIRNESINAHKEYARRARNEISITELIYKETNQPFLDKMPPITTDRFRVRDDDICIYDSNLSAALHILRPSHREIVLRAFSLNRRMPKSPMNCILACRQ